ncbi:hypothetical protein HY570_04230 [Candidatus Micrarchaeota archaeon]|nr:hypothetical protein [Candidatus Micrarchaeota archaeon]
MNRIMRSLLVSLLLVYFLSLVFAETQEIALNVSQVTGIVNVTSDIEFNKILVGYEYKGKINVDWAIPEEALKGINAEKVVIDVSIKRGAETKSVTFLDENRTKEELSFDLVCLVVEDRCSENSTLRKSVDIVFIVNDDVSSLNALVIINSSLKKLERQATNQTVTGNVQQSQSLDTDSVLSTIRQNGVAIVAGIIALLLIIYLIKKI